MSDFELYFKSGLWHVLDINAYDHILFLIALTLPYAFKEWRKVLLLVTLFTIGHTMSLILAVFGIVNIKSDIVETIIPITILVTAVYNIITRRKRFAKLDNENINFISIITLFIGVVHGLGFYNFFKMQVESGEEKLVPVLEFALGVETAQIIVVLIVLIISGIVESILRVTRRDWVILVSSFIIGVITQMLMTSEIW
jgi:hypothetical protein